MVNWRHLWCPMSSIAWENSGWCICGKHKEMFYGVYEISQTISKLPFSCWKINVSRYKFTVKPNPSVLGKVAKLNVIKMLLKIKNDRQNKGYFATIKIYRWLLKKQWRLLFTKWPSFWLSKCKLTEKCWKVIKMSKFTKFRNDAILEHISSPQALPNLQSNYILFMSRYLQSPL